MNLRVKLPHPNLDEERSTTVNLHRHCLSFILILFFASSIPALAQAQPGAAPAKGVATQGQTAKSPAKEAEPAKQTKSDDESIPPAKPGDLFPAVVARVNGHAILGRDLEQRVRAELAPIGNPKWDNLREDYRQELVVRSLSSLISAELIYEKALGVGIKANPAEVKTEFDKMAKGFANDTALNTALAERGIDRPELMKQIEKNLIVGKYVQENVAKTISVLPAEVSLYYSTHQDEFRHGDMVRTSHILIAVPEGASEQQNKALKERAEGLLARAQKGEDFAKLAKENSMDSSASDGGDIGYASKGQLTPEYEAAAFSLPAGAISSLVRTQFGYHVIKVTDKKKEGLATLEEVRNELTEFLKNQQTETALQKLVTELRSKAKVEVYIPLPGAAAPEGTTTSSPRP